MKLLLAGVRGVGKSTIGMCVEKLNGMPFISISDLLRRELSGSSGASEPLYKILEELSPERRLAIYQKIIGDLQTLKDFILEMPIVERGAFGIMIPIEPVIRFVDFDALMLLESDQNLISERRRSRPPKKQDPLYLKESADEIGAHQTLCRYMLIAFGVTLARPVFIIKDVGSASATAQTILAAAAAARDDISFYKSFARMS